MLRLIRFCFLVFILSYSMNERLDLKVTLNIEAFIVALKSCLFSQGVLLKSMRLQKKVPVGKDN